MENKRPTFVTIVCIFLFIEVPLGFIVVLFNLMSSVNMALYGLAMSPWYSIFSIPWAIFYLVAVIFIWKMKKIGLIAYTGLAIIDYTLGLIGGFDNISGIIWGVILIGLLWTQFKKMSWGYNLNKDSSVENSGVSSNIVEASDKSSSENKRPILVTIICVFKFIALLFSLFLFFSDPKYYGLLPLWIFVSTIGATILSLVAIIFIWKMRKVGLIVYTGVTIITYLISFIVDAVPWASMVVETILISLLWTQFGKMKWGINLSNENSGSDSSNWGLGILVFVIFVILASGAFIVTNIYSNNFNAVSLELGDMGLYSFSGISYHNGSFFHAVVDGGNTYIMKDNKRVSGPYLSVYSNVFDEGIYFNVLTNGAFYILDEKFEKLNEEGFDSIGYCDFIEEDIACMVSFGEYSQQLYYKGELISDKYSYVHSFGEVDGEIFYIASADEGSVLVYEGREFFPPIYDGEGLHSSSLYLSVGEEKIKEIESRYGAIFSYGILGEEYVYTTKRDGKFYFVNGDIVSELPADDNVNTFNYEGEFSGKPYFLKNKLNCVKEDGGNICNYGGSSLYYDGEDVLIDLPMPYSVEDVSVLDDKFLYVVEFEERRAIVWGDEVLGLEYDDIAGYGFGSYLVVDEKLVFIGIRDAMHFVVYDGSKLGPYLFVRQLIDVDKKLAFVANERPREIKLFIEE